MTEPQSVRRLAHYELRGEIGRGGMGVVYEAQDGRLQRPVAIKVPPAPVAGLPGHRARLLREAAPLGDVFVAPNATKHMLEIVAGNAGRAGSAATGEASFALMVKSLEQAISQAAIQGGILLNRIIVVGGWELKFALGRAGEPVKPVLIHARWLIFWQKGCADGGPRAERSPGSRC